MQRERLGDVKNLFRAAVTAAGASTPWKPSSILEMARKPHGDRTASATGSRNAKKLLPKEG